MDPVCRKLVYDDKDRYMDDSDCGVHQSDRFCDYVYDHGAQSEIFPETAEESRRN